LINGVSLLFIAEYEKDIFSLFLMTYSDQYQYQYNLSLLAYFDLPSNFFSVNGHWLVTGVIQGLE